jgi:hypothetical protein
MSDQVPAPSRRARKRDQRVRRACRQIVVVAPHLDDPKYRPLVQAFARISLLNIDAFEHLREKGLVNAEGELRSSVDTFQRLVNTQLKLAEKLGLTPSALGKLSKARPVDLAAAMSAHEEEIVDAESK